jgi:hypothetical protein
MSRFATWFLLLVIVALPFGMVAAQDEEEAVDTSEWVLFEAESAYLFAPENWLDLTDPDLMDIVIDEADNISPEVGAYMDIVEPALRQADIEFFLIDPITAASVNLLVLDVGFEAPLDFFEEDFLYGYELVGAEVIEVGRVEIGGVEALRAQVVVPFGDPVLGYDSMGQIQYAFVDGTNLFALTFASDEALFDEYEAIFEAIAESFGIGEAPHEE